MSKKTNKNERVDLKKFIIDPNILNEIPLALMERNNIIPFKKDKKTLYIATSTPEDFELQSIIENETGQSVKFVYAESSDIKAAILSRLKIKTIFGSLEEPDYANSNQSTWLLNVVKLIQMYYQTYLIFQIYQTWLTSFLFPSFLITHLIFTWTLDPNPCLSE